MWISVLAKGAAAPIVIAAEPANRSHRKLAFIYQLIDS